MTQTRATGSLVCPKCGGEMRAYERNNVTIDQCADCRGIFLDRGELEQLVDAEASYYERGSRREPDLDRGFGSDEHDDEHRGKQGGRRRGGFLGNLFD